MAVKIVHTYPLAWEGTTPEATIAVERETNDEGDTVRFKAHTPNVPDLEPRYGETRSEAIQSLQRSLWAWYSNGNNAAKANKEK